MEIQEYNEIVIINGITYVRMKIQLVGAFNNKMSEYIESLEFELDNLKNLQNLKTIGLRKLPQNEEQSTIIANLKATIDAQNIFCSNLYKDNQDLNKQIEGMKALSKLAISEDTLMQNNTIQALKQQLKVEAQNLETLNIGYIALNEKIDNQKKVINQHLQVNKHNQALCSYIKKQGISNAEIQTIMNYYLAPSEIVKPENLPVPLFLSNTEKIKKLEAKVENQKKQILVLQNNQNEIKALKYLLRTVNINDQEMKYVIDKFKVHFTKASQIVQIDENYTPEAIAEIKLLEEDLAELYLENQELQKTAKFAIELDTIANDLHQKNITQQQEIETLRDEVERLKKSNNNELEVEDNLQNLTTKSDTLKEKGNNAPYKSKRFQKIYTKAKENLNNIPINNDLKKKEE